MVHSGCDLLQGYLILPPHLAEAELFAWQQATARLGRRVVDSPTPGRRGTDQLAADR